jgi:hypothetical protein
MASPDFLFLGDLSTFLRETISRLCCHLRIVNPPLPPFSKGGMGGFETSRYRYTIKKTGNYRWIKKVAPLIFSRDVY